MVKLTAPMMSLAASGTLGKAITFSNWKGRAYARTRVIPSNPRSGLQTGMRAGITAAPLLWNDQMDAAARALWDGGVGSEAISGFNLFTRASQKSIRNNYGPIIGFADQDQSETPAAPSLGSADQDGTDVDVTWTDDAATKTVLVFHSTSTGFTPSIATLVAIIPDGVELFVHRNPGLGAHYYDIRSGADDGGVGALRGEFTETVV